MVWYSYLFKNFPVCCDPYSQRFSVNEAKEDVFLKLPCFLHDPMNVGNLISESSASWKLSLYIWKFLVLVLLSLACRILSIPHLRDIIMILVFLCLT